MSGDATGAAGLLDFDAATQQTFNAAFWASYPPIIGKTFNAATAGNTPPATLAAKAIAFAQQGYKLHTYIMVKQQDPYITMRLLAELGFASVPAVGELAEPLAPTLGGETNAGSFKVSLKLEDYPPYPVPVAPPVAGRSPVGALLTGKTHLANMPESSTYHNGDRATFSGATYTFNFPGIFSPPLWIAD